jgi:hypothetical protein
VVRGLLALVVGPLFGHTTLHFPLYIVEALLVEAIASVRSPEKQLSFGAWCGLAIGTLGVAGEWAWSHAWMTMSWTSSLFPEIALAILAGTAAGVLGGFIARSLDAPEQRERVPRGLGLATGAALIVCLAIPLPIGTVDASATVAVANPGVDTSRLDITLDPPTLADGAEWFNVTAWQGGGSVVSPLEEVGPGHYRSGPVPLYGEWKTLIRLHTGSAVVAVPVYLPADPAIPADGVPAPAHVTRTFVPDKQILLREAKDTPTWMSAVGYSALGLIVVVWITTLAWGLHRMLEDGSESRRGSTRYLRVRLTTN